MTLASRVRRRRPSREKLLAKQRRRADRLRKYGPWLAPVFVWLYLTSSVSIPIVPLEFAIAGLIALWVVRFFVKRPERALQALIIYLPYQLLLFFAVPYALGVPVDVIRFSSFFKETLALTIVIAGFRKARAERHRFDLADKLALGYAALGLVFLLVPQLLTTDPVGLSRSLSDRGLGFRSDIVYALIFVGARHVRLSTEHVRMLTRTLLAVTIGFGVIAIFEFTGGDAWNDFVVNTLHYEEVQQRVLDITPAGIVPFGDVRVYGTLAGTEFVRVGGPLFQPLGFSFALVMLIAIATESMLRRVSTRALLALALGGFAVLATQTRSAIAAAMLVLGLGLVPKRGVSGPAQFRFTLLAAAALVVAVPLALGSGITDRLTQGDAASDTLHEQSVDASVEGIVENPLGRGLTTGAGAAQRLGKSDFLVSENQLLSTGLQFGVAGMALFAGFYAAAAVQALRLGRRLPGAVGALASGSGAALVGLAFVGWYLTPLSVFAVSWVLFAVVGAAIGAAEREETEVPALLDGGARVERP